LVQYFEPERDCLPAVFERHVRVTAGGPRCCCCGGDDYGRQLLQFAQYISASSGDSRFPKVG
jgi:hypothetical protein